MTEAEMDEQIELMQNETHYQYAGEMDKAEYLLNYCAENECPSHDNCDVCVYDKGRADVINAIKNDLHKRLTEEMNNPYQDQGLCEGLLYGIQRCDWYLDDSKEQKE